MALLTACVPELCRAALARHRLKGYFRQIIFVQELGLEKRNPEAFTRSLALLGPRPGTAPSSRTPRRLPGGPGCGHPGRGGV